MTMIQSAGALQRPITPYAITLRPPPLAWEEEADTVPDLLSPVLRAIILGYQNEVKTDSDFPYMPFPQTTCKEAMNHLVRRGYILINGGRIDHIAGWYRLRLWGEQGVPSSITTEDVEEILFAHYPSA